jgi:hypothetical protein
VTSTTCESTPRRTTSSGWRPDLRLGPQHLRLLPGLHLGLTDVYATARPGLRSRLGSRLAAQARARRHERFRALTGAGEGTRILDVGCGALGLRRSSPAWTSPEPTSPTDPTTPGRSCRPTPPTGCRSTTAPSTSRTRAASSSTSRPSAGPPSPARSAGSRAGGGPDARILVPGRAACAPPAAHWLPPALRRPYWRMGVAGEWEDIALLRRGELEALFGPLSPSASGRWRSPGSAFTRQ